MQYVNFNASKIIRFDGAVVHGYVVTATVAAVVNIIDGTSASGTVVMPLAIPVNTTVSLNGFGIPFDTGVYVQVVSGTVTGSVFVE